MVYLKFGVRQLVLQILDLPTGDCLLVTRTERIIMIILLNRRHSPIRLLCKLAFHSSAQTLRAARSLGCITLKSSVKRTPQPLTASHVPSLFVPDKHHNLDPFCADDMPFLVQLNQALEYEQLQCQVASNDHLGPETRAMSSQ
jgi:hypothetical protein